MQEKLDINQFLGCLRKIPKNTFFDFLNQNIFFHQAQTMCIILKCFKVNMNF